MSDNPSLAKQVIQDISTVGKWPLVFLILNMLTALSVVYVTHETRLIVAKHDKLLNERDKLDSEMRNILLEEYSLSEHSRIEAIARKELKMIRPDSQKEIIVSK